MHEIQAKGLLLPNNGMNIYRGCQHGCIYCDSRSVCYQMDHEFEDIEVKINAPELLEAKLKSKRERCMIGTGSMTDPYIPLEKELCLTRRCLELIERYGFGFSVITKSTLLLRDIELLKSINEQAKCVVSVTLTTFDEDLCRVLEPNVSTTRERFEMLQILQQNGIPTIVWLSPILPFINDTEENLLGILDYCERAGVYGVLCFGIGMTLREGSRDYFYARLDERFPGLRQRYAKTYGSAYMLDSPNNSRLYRVFQDFCGARGIVCDTDALFSYMRAFTPKYEQMRFDI